MRAYDWRQGEADLGRQAGEAVMELRAGEDRWDIHEGGSGGR